MDTKEIKENLIQAYQRHAHEREAGPTADWKIKKREDFLALLQRKQKQSLLEIGAGTGKDSLFFQQNGLTVTCIDLAPEMINLCKQKGLNAHVMDMIDLQFPPEMFDAVYSINSLLHVPKLSLPIVQKNIQRILKIDGLFQFGTYGGKTEFQGFLEKDTYTPKRFFAFYPDETIKQLTAPYFELVSFSRIDFPDKDMHFQCLILRKG